ncbi:unnamed protein product [Macrosiphum euphorbiae]|uniref:Uncharacterized protein n=1 Tax=Macrosiphum euphorbiae TaxID=13131 RepID=A0AAV0XVN1_9HEMI|nr:unnamed protein product [Macrosiphum euphorbiae]
MATKWSLIPQGKSNSSPLTWPWNSTPATNLLVANSIRTLKTLAKLPFQPVSLEEVNNIIKRLPCNKAPGSEDISNTTLRYFSDNTLLTLTKCSTAAHISILFYSRKSAIVIMI